MLLSLLRAALSAMRLKTCRRLVLFTLSMVISLTGCLSAQSYGQAGIPDCLRDTLQQSDGVAQLMLPLSASSKHQQVLEESWLIYRDRFIQGDGRVIDREDNDRTVSEGQAYAMLRAVLINDPDTFVRTFNWAEDNLRRRDEAGELIDQLWSWKWGRNSRNEWTTLDRNFAIDADIDAATALILAAERWNCPEYLAIAQQKINDIWTYSTLEVRGERYLLPGPPEAFFNQSDRLILNPSYLAPAAFRLFATVDQDHDWMRLVDHSYAVLEETASLSTVGLPADWINLNPETGEFETTDAVNTGSKYGFDAYRVWWRVVTDAAWFNEPRADVYLRDHLQHLQTLWETEQAIPAVINPDGTAAVEYESTAQYGLLYGAFQRIDPALAEDLYQKKLKPQYENGIWDNDNAYYTQNLAWFGLFPMVSDPVNAQRCSESWPAS